MKIEEAINVIDIYPTLAFLAGAKVAEELNIEGINFWRILNEATISKDRTMYWKLNNGTALKKGEWKLIHNGKTIEKGTDELYNTEPFAHFFKSIQKKYQGDLVVVTGDNLDYCNCGRAENGELSNNKNKFGLRS